MSKKFVYILNFNIQSNYGGKRGRRTMKKRNRKTRKFMKKNQKGGYVYSASKELDNASSIINISSIPKSSSTSKTKSKNHKSRRSSSK